MRNLPGGPPFDRLGENDRYFPLLFSFGADIVAVIDLNFVVNTVAIQFTLLLVRLVTTLCVLSGRLTLFSPHHLLSIVCFLFAGLRAPRFVQLEVAVAMRFFLSSLHFYYAVFDVLRGVLLDDGSSLHFTQHHPAFLRYSFLFLPCLSVEVQPLRVSA